MTELYYMNTDALPAETQALAAFLSPARREKIARARRDVDKRLLLAAGLTLDFALRAHGLCEKDAAIALGEYGKPRLADRDDLHFSLSHSGSVALCAISDNELGADVEAPRAIRDALLRRVCTEEEYAALSACAPEEKETLFLRLWTAKESFLKYLGTGLTRDARSFFVLKDGAPVPPEDGLYFDEYALCGCRACVCCLDKNPPAPREVFP